MEKKCCSLKKKIRDKTEQDMLIDRLNRISGQVSGIKQMVEDSRYCDDILTQIAAVSSSLKSLGIVVMENHMKTCVKEQIQEGHDEVIDEFLKSISRLCR